LAAAIVVTGLVRGVAIFDEFVEGAKLGLQITVRLFPFLLAMLLAVGCLRASGFMTVFTNTVGSFTELLGFPREVLPLALLRPLTGSGAMAVTADILDQHGPDSFLGLLASTVQGSTDTTLYIVTVYFGSVGIKRLRHSLITGLIADAAAAIAAVIVCTLLFR
jgi:spore maturation protein B